MGRIAQAVERWGDDWSIDQTIAPLGVISYAQDCKDYGIMRSLMDRPLFIHQVMERRHSHRRISDI